MVSTANVKTWLWSVSGTCLQAPIAIGMPFLEYIPLLASNLLELGYLGLLWEESYTPYTSLYMLVSRIMGMIRYIQSYL